jgi:hypothetical protein
VVWAGSDRYSNSTRPLFSVRPRERRPRGRTLHGLIFLSRRSITAAQAPSLVLEERLADAAETALAEQIGSDSGNELLAPNTKDDDPIALEDPS